MIKIHSLLMWDMMKIVSISFVLSSIYKLLMHWIFKQDQPPQIITLILLSSCSKAVREFHSHSERVKTLNSGILSCPGSLSTPTF